MRGLAQVGWLAVLLCVAAAAAEPPALDVRLEPGEATIGDPLTLTLDVDLPAGSRLDTVSIGPELGPFAVLDGAWNGPVEDGERLRWSWSGTLAVFETGTLELPAISLELTGLAEPTKLVSDPVAVEIVSVLTVEERDGAEAELSDLKPPASIRPDYEPLWVALIILGALLALAALLWWLHRRYAAGLAAAPVPTDPFRRTAPHVWVYAELRKLLDRRLPEQGQVDLFYEELSRILRRYLGGRYRIDLMEHTTEEIPTLLRQTGIEAEALRSAVGLLQDCDRVKFARARPDALQCRTAVEQVYGIVDRTKPLEAGAAQPAVAAGGA